MIRRLRKWKYAKMIRGSVFLAFGLIFLMNGGSMKYLEAVLMFFLSIICFLDKPLIK